MQEKAKQIVVDYFNNHVDATNNKKITIDDVFVVWFAKTLQNWKALVSTTVSDGMYYEITHNGDKKETYVDAYKKWEKGMVCTTVRRAKKAQRSAIPDSDIQSRYV